MTVRALSVVELKKRLAAGGPRFIDVRSPEEWQIARIEGFERVDRALVAELEALPTGTELVFLCHHGMRSAAAAEHFRERGFANLWNVTGGIDAWSREVDADVPRY